MFADTVILKVGPVPGAATSPQSRCWGGDRSRTALSPPELPWAMLLEVTRKEE